LNSIIEFEQKIENKRYLWKRSLLDQERHLALEMPTLEMAHTERERERALAKQHQGKDEVTKGQQDLPVNMVINYRLLAYKA
jgi:hypothetical protein